MVVMKLAVTVNGNNSSSTAVSDDQMDKKCNQSGRERA